MPRKPVSVHARFDGASFTLMLKPREAELLCLHLEEDIGNLRPVIPSPILSLLESLEKALARKSVILMWKREQGCFAWQRSAEWIELQLREEEFKDFVESATAMPRFSRDPGPPSDEPERRWPCLSDVALLIKILTAMHKRRGLKFGCHAMLEIADVFSGPGNED